MRPTPQYPAAKFRLTYNEKFSILRSSKSEFLSNLYSVHQKASSYQIYTPFIKKRVLIKEQLWRMVRRRHQNKSKGWLIKRYWSATGRKHRFAVRIKAASGRKTVYEVIKLHAIGIRRYIKIKADANPYLQVYAKYFSRRRHYKESKLLAAMSARELRAMQAAGG
jgi:hypothetical protein